MLKSLNENIELKYTDIFDGKKEKTLIFSSHIITQNYNKKSLFTVMIDGKSMEPVINHKAIVVADLTQKSLEDESIYLVYHENKMWIKKYNFKKGLFYSINPDYSHLVYKKDEVHLVAKVLLTFTNL